MKRSITPNGPGGTRCWPRSTSPGSGSTRRRGTGTDAEHKRGRLSGMSSLFEDLRWRGLVHQMTDPDALPKLLDQDTLIAYIGFDPTADSLHVGHFQQICLLRRLQEAGHRPIALVGGGTGLIGDPTFKENERPLLSRDDLARNTAGIRRQL